MGGELSLACIGEKRVMHNPAIPDHTIRCVRSCNVEQQTDDHLSFPAFLGFNYSGTLSSSRV